MSMSKLKLEQSTTSTIEAQSNHVSKLINRCLHLLHHNGYSNVKRQSVAEIVNKYLVHEKTECNDVTLLSLLEQFGKSTLEKILPVHDCDLSTRLSPLPNNFIHNLFVDGDSTYIITGSNILINDDNTTAFNRAFDEKVNILKSTETHQYFTRAGGVVKDKYLSLLVYSDDEIGHLIYQYRMSDGNITTYKLPKYGSGSFIAESFVSYTDKENDINFTLAIYDELEKVRRYIKLKLNSVNGLANVSPVLKSGIVDDLKENPEWIPVANSFNEVSPFGKYISKYQLSDENVLESLTINIDVKTAVNVDFKLNKIGNFTKVVEANYNPTTGLTHILGTDAIKGCFTMLVLDKDKHVFQYYPSITNNHEFSSRVQKIVGLTNSNTTKSTVSLVKLINNELWLTGWDTFGISKRLLIDNLSSNNFKHTPIKVSICETAFGITTVKVLLRGESLLNNHNHDKSTNRKNFMLTYKLTFDKKSGWFTLVK